MFTCPKCKAGYRRIELMTGSPIPRQLALSPMRVLSRRIKHPLDVTVQRLHDADPREHRWAAGGR
jgi:hypothetical protein